MPTFENYLNKDVADIIADKDAIVTTDKTFRVAVTADGGFYESYFMSLEGDVFMVQTASLQTAALVKEDGSVQTGQLLSQVPQGDILRLKYKTIAVRETAMLDEGSQEVSEDASVQKEDKVTADEKESAGPVTEEENKETVLKEESEEHEDSVQETTIGEELHPIVFNGKDAFTKALYINAENKDHAVLVTGRGTVFELSVTSYDDLTRIDIFSTEGSQLISAAFFRGDKSVDAIVKSELFTAPPDSLGRILKDIFDK